MNKLSKVDSKRALQTLQRAFASIIRRSLTSTDRMKPDRRSDVMIAPSKQLTPHERLEMYAQQYWWRIEDSFDEDFVSLRLVLGEKRYRMLRDAYLLRVPSRSFTLRNLGKALPRFIKNNPQLVSTKARLAYDAACYDWGLIEAFDAPDAAPLTQSFIRSRKVASTTLSLHPSIQLLECRYPIHTLRTAMKNSSQQVASNAGLTRSKQSSRKSGNRINEESSYLVIHRQMYTVYVKSVSRVQFQLLKKLSKGSTLDALLTPTIVKSEHDMNQIQQTFAEWVSLGWLTKKAK